MTWEGIEKFSAEVGSVETSPTAPRMTLRLGVRRRSRAAARDELHSRH